MANPYVLAAAISTVGTLLGALGGVALASGASARQEERQARREERRADRQQAEARAQACWAACADLLGAAAQFRIQIQIIGSSYWADMNVKLATAQDQVTSVGLCASRVALLVPGQVADAAIALSLTAGEMAATVARDARLAVHGDPAQMFRGGELPAAPDLRVLDARVDAFRGAAAGAVSGEPAGGTPAVPGPPG